MQLTVIGTGYVGLVTGACLADVGNDVICVDIDKAKITKLQRNILPISEPGLQDIVERCQADSRLSFTVNIAEGVKASEIIFICVGTPNTNTGTINLDAVKTIIKYVREQATSPKIVVMKSTVLPGTNAKLLDMLNAEGASHTILSNPEFLREGCAVKDFMEPDRVLIGHHENVSMLKLYKIYAAFIAIGVPVINMSLEDAEMAKYAANCFLAMKISYANQLAMICETVGADVLKVLEGIKHDARIGDQFLNPGFGYGGSCFPKDIEAFVAFAQNIDCPATFAEAAKLVNYNMFKLAVEKVREASGGLKGKTIGILGLAFKPETDDIRHSIGVHLADYLVSHGARVQVYDPEAMKNTWGLLRGAVTYANDPYTAADCADTLVLCTEWDEFNEINWVEMKSVMKGCAFVDGRNMFDGKTLESVGFKYTGVGV